MTEDLFVLLEQRPAFFIVYILFSILLTAAVYGAFPLIFAGTRNRTVTQKKYNRLCFGINLAVCIFFSLMNGSFSFSPYLLWTWIFSASGSKKLQAKGLMEGYEGDVLPDDPNRIVECKACGYRSREYFEACPSCGKFAKRYTYTSHTGSRENKIRFCGRCGTELTEGSRFCHNCGTQVF